MNWYLVINRGTDPAEDPERLARHLDWMQSQHEHGTVLISGPSSDLTMGLFVVRAHSPRRGHLRRNRRSPVPSG